MIYCATSLNDVQEIFKACFKNDILRVMVFIPDEDDNLLGYTYRPFLHNSCRNSLPYFIEYLRFDTLDLFIKEVFQKKRMNFEMCPLNISVVDFAPFTMFSSNLLTMHGSGFNHPNRRSETVWGIEGVVIKILAEYHNFTINVLPKAVEANTVFGEVLNCRSDIAVGGLSFNDFWEQDWFKNFSISNTYYQTYLVIILRRRLDNSSLNRFLRPLTLPVWILLAVLSVAFLVLFNVVKYKTKKLTKPFSYLGILEFLTIFFGYPTGFKTKANFPRFMVACLLLVSLVMRTAYQGTMFNAIRMNNQLHFPKTKDEMLQRGYGFYYDGYEFESEFSDRMRILTTSRERLAFMMTIERLSYYNMRHKRAKDMVLIPKSYVSYRFAMVYRRGSFLLRAFNTRVHEINGIGIYSMLYRLFADAKYNYYDPKSNISPIITFEKLLVVFEMHVFLLGVSFVVLLVELLYSKFRALFLFTYVE